jgi:hypothetical protein
VYLVAARAARELPLPSSWLLRAQPPKGEEAQFAGRSSEGICRRLDELPSGRRAKRGQGGWALWGWEPEELLIVETKQMNKEVQN